jgi:hypothetical protein
VKPSIVTESRFAAHPRCWADLSRSEEGMTGSFRPASWTNIIWFGSGVLSAVGTLFLLQELVRTWLDIRSLQGGTVAPWSQPGGVLHLSGAAWPSAAFYLIGHVWILTMAVRWLKGSAPSPGLTALLGLLVLLSAGVHFFVWGPFRMWVLWPTLF